MSNVYYKTFTRPNVDLITDPIDSITATGIRTADGAHREIDALVLAIGFEVSYSPSCTGLGCAARSLEFLRQSVGPDPPVDSDDPRNGV